MSKTIVLIHGAWLTPAAWERFRSRYEPRGYTTVAPPWPMEDVPIDELRRHPHPELHKLSISRIVDHYEKVIRDLPEAPIIMGHSFGGLFAQLLLDRGLGVAGVGISPGNVRGVVPSTRTLVSALPIFTAWNGWNRVLTMSYRQFATNFANRLPEDEMRPAYERFIVPTPGRIYWQGALAIGTGITANNPGRAPLLLIAGEFDRIVSESLVRALYRKQSRAPSVTEFKSFPGRSHFLFHEPGWEEVADYALEWAVRHARPSGATAPTTRKPALR